MKYPSYVYELNEKLTSLANICESEDRLKDIRYRADFEVIDAFDEFDISTKIVSNQKTHLSVLCKKHDHIFRSNGRYLFSRSITTNFVTCIHCDGKRPYHTVQSVTEAISIAEDFQFRLNISEEMGLTQNSIIKVHDSLPLVCTKILPNGNVCGYSVPHTIGNILHSIKHPGHLLCQGACDSKKKGKARRRSLISVKKQLKEARGGCWIINEASYRKMSEPLNVIHVKCGESSFRLLDHVISFPTKTGRSKETDKDCPYCNPKSARRLLQADVALYSSWLKHVTGGEIEYISGSIAPGTRTKIPIRVRCVTCSSKFDAFEAKILKNRFHCCTVCHDSFIHSQRAWDIEEAKEIVERRGFVLHGDPENYTKPADIRLPDGTTANFSDILSLVKIKPAKADGFGKDDDAPLDLSNGGKLYSEEDIKVIRQMHAENRSKRYICEKLKRSYGSVSQKCIDLKLRFDEYEHYKRFFHVNDNFFSVPSVENSYWAGLFAADGTISKEICIELKAIDEIVLQQLMKEIYHTGTLAYRTVDNVDGRGIYAGLRFRSAQIAQDLQQIFNITARKSRNIAPPNLHDSKMIMAFICGLLEGDGTVSITNRGELKASLLTASPSMADWLKRQVESIINAPPPIHTVSQGRHWIREITLQGENARVFLSSLTTTISGHMRRKWTIFEEHLKLRSQDDRIAIKE